MVLKFVKKYWLVVCLVLVGGLTTHEYSIIAALGWYLAALIYVARIQIHDSFVEMASIADEQDQLLREMLNSLKK